MPHLSGYGRHLSTIRAYYRYSGMPKIDSTLNAVSHLSIACRRALLGSKVVEALQHPLPASERAAFRRRFRRCPGSSAVDDERAVSPGQRNPGPQPLALKAAAAQACNLRSGSGFVIRRCNLMPCAKLAARRSSKTKHRCENQSAGAGPTPTDICPCVAIRYDAMPTVYPCPNNVPVPKCAETGEPLRSWRF